MGGKLYVAGPVIHPTRRLDRLIGATFSAIGEQCHAQGFEASLPTHDPHVDALEPGGFAETIRARITEADGVVSVHWPGDQAVVVESVLASLLGKPQVILAPGISAVPRMLRALPGVEVVEISLDQDSVREAIKGLIRRVEADWAAR